MADVKQKVAFPRINCLVKRASRIAIVAATLAGAGGLVFAQGASVHDLTFPEGNTGTTDFVFTVTLPFGPAVPASVDWATFDYTAVSPDDYAASSGTVHFGVGQDTATFIVPVVADRELEGPNLFGITLSNPVNCFIIDGEGWGTITNDDVGIRAGCPTQYEGNTGTTDFVCEAWLTGTYEFDVSVDWETSDNTAVSPDDYAASSGTVHIPAGETEGAFIVPVVADRVHEITIKTFTVNLSNPVNATITDSTGLGYIEDDDVGVWISDLAQDEGDTGTTDFEFTVTLTNTYDVDVSVDWATTDGTAVSPDDYIASSGTVNIPMGETTGTIVVPVLGDDVWEVEEWFQVDLLSALHCTLTDCMAYGTIANDDGPAVSIGDVLLDEGDTGTTAFQFDITLGESSPDTVSVDWVTADGTALAGEDYVQASGTATFLPGETLETVGVLVLGDDLDECDEDFTVELSNPVNGDIVNGQAIGTIVNDDPLGCADFDADCYQDDACGGRDCDDTNPSIYPGAPEINDGQDNQCPGDYGHGAADEISGVCEFGIVSNTTFLFFPDQEYATTYEVARSPSPTFSTDCILWSPVSLGYIYDGETPAPGGAFFYVVRPLTPYAGSWGLSSQGERDFVCPTP